MSAWDSEPNPIRKRKRRREEERELRKKGRFTLNLEVAFVQACNLGLGEQSQLD